MKKLLFAALSLILVLGLSCFVGCDGGGNNRGDEDFDPMDALIINDIYEQVGDNVYGSSISSKHYVLVFDYGLNTYRMWAEVPSDIIDAIFDLDFFDKDREKKERDLLKDLPIGEVENLTDAMPTPFDCEKYIGKTGQELLDMGFICNGYSIYEGQDPRFFLDFGDYEYEITMNERVVDIAEDASYEELFAPRTVKSVQCDGVGHGSLDIFDDYE